MANPAAKEPSMEDILSSIRKIVSQEDEVSRDNEVAENPSAKAAPTAGPDPAEGSFAKLAKQARGIGEKGNEPAHIDDETEEARSIDMNAGLQSVASETSVPETADVDATPNPQEPQMNSPAEAQATRQDEFDQTGRTENDNDGEIVGRQESAFKDALVAPATQESVSDSFEKMKKRVLENIDERMDALMRPMLAAWLDENLSEIVERIVREEIQKIAKIS